MPEDIYQLTASISLDDDDDAVPWTFGNEIKQFPRSLAISFTGDCGVMCLSIDLARFHIQKLQRNNTAAETE